MDSNRRDFILRSTLAVAAGALGSSRLFAQQPRSRSTGAADRSRVCLAAAECRYFYRARRHDGMDGRARRRRGHRQPVRRHVEDVPRRLQADDRRTEDRPADQHAPSSRSHRGQQGAAAVGREDRRAGERSRPAAETGGRAEERGRAGVRRHHVQDGLEGRSGKRGRHGSLLRPGHTSGDGVDLLPEGQHRAHG